jgi:hypothetical protein
LLLGFLDAVGVVLVGVVVSTGVLGLDHFGLEGY